VDAPAPLEDDFESKLVSCRRALLGTGLAVASLAFPAVGQAAFETGLNDTDLYASEDSAERERAFDQTVDLQAGIVRLDVNWGAIASREPANPTDPADPAYEFARYDLAVQAAAARDLRVLFTFLNAPSFAQGSDRPDQTFDGSWKPSPAALGDFAQALATRYSGSFNGLPRVQFFEPWNEPNLDFFLAPQYEQGKAFAPGHYRRMVNAVHDGVSAVASDNTVIAGSNAPYGDEPGGIRTRPLVFLRDFLCLDRKLKGVDCAESPQFDVFSHHPINLSGGPRLSAVDPDDASSADLSNVAEVLRAAERQGTIAGARKRHPLWVTEFWWESFPDGGAAAKPGLKRHGRWIQEALFLFWKAGADAAINLQLVDSPFGPDTPDSFQTGLILEDGAKKPAYASFRFPFVTERRAKAKLFAWGKAPASGKLTIERKQGGDWQKVKRLNAKDGKVFTTSLRERGKATYRARIGEQTSLPWKQGKKVDEIEEPGKLARSGRPLTAPATADPWHTESPPSP